MDVLSPFISVLCHSGWLYHGESCPCLDVVHPGCALPSSPACTWHCSLHYLFLQALVSSWCDRGMLVSLLWQCLTVPSPFSAFLRTHLFVFFAVHETCRIFLCPFVSKASRHVSFFPSVWLSQPYTATGHTNAFISRIFIEIGMLWLFHIFWSAALCLTWYGIPLCSPSSVIRDPRYGNVSTCSICSFWISMRHAMLLLTITLVLSTLMSRLYLRLTQSRRSTNSCSSASEVANRMMSSA